jgi:hypothetical protein
MSNRFLILIIGILIGIIIAGGTIWYYSTVPGKNIFIVNHHPVKPDLNEKNQVKAKNKPSGNSAKPSKDQQDLLEVETSKEDSLKLIEAKEEKEVAVISDNNVKTDSVFAVNEELIVVKKDEMLLSFSVTLLNLDMKAEVSNKKDSLLQLVSGIKEPTANNVFIVEYWKSPINYRGYKSGKNKIVLFGLQSVSPPLLFKLNEVIYLKNLEKVYRIERTNDFKSFELINDPSIINQLQ